MHLERPVTAATEDLVFSVIGSGPRLLVRVKRGLIVSPPKAVKPC